MEEPKFKTAKKLLNVTRMKDHPLYKVLDAVRRRCYQESASDYSYYGGRGIGVCDRWMEDCGMGLVNFVEDMGDKPSDLHTLDRVDPNKDYSPSNCKWATRKEQVRNRRKFKNNKSGYTGVRLLEYSYPAKWQALCRGLDGRPKKRTFSVKKYGYEGAKLLAIEARNMMLEELNEQGAGYSENHGK